MTTDAPKTLGEMRTAAMAGPGVDARSEAEQGLSRLAAIVESSDDAIIGMDLNGIVTCWNKGAEKIFGYRAGEMTGNSILQLIPDDRRDEGDHILGKIRRGEEVKHFETVRRRKDGRSIQVSVTASPIRDPSGAVTGVSKVARDISDRKEAEHAARRLAAIVESSDDAIIGKDLGSLITSWNHGAQRLFGYTAEEMVGTSIMRLIPSERQGEEDHILGKIRRGEVVKHFETVRLTKNGSLLDVSVTASPIRDTGGVVVGVSKVARDITERKRSETRIEYLNRVYAVLSDINQTIVREKNPQAVIESACRVAVEKGRFRSAWIGLVDAEGGVMRVAAQYGPADAGPGVPQLLAGEHGPGGGHGLALRAITTGERQVWNDSTDRNPSMMDSASWAAADTRAMASLPLKVEGNVIGVFTLCANDPGCFDDTEIRLLDELAMDIGFALGVSRREVQRREGEQRYRALFDCAPDGILISDVKGRCVDANWSVCRLLGYTRGEIVGMAVSEISVPMGSEVVEAGFSETPAGPGGRRAARYRRKDGSL